jgi:hypothetical protein
MVTLDLNKFMLNVYGFNLYTYELGYCHKYPNIQGCLDARISKALPYVTDEEIKHATSHFLRQDYITKYDAEYYSALKKDIQPKILKDFKCICDDLNTSTIGIHFEETTLTFYNDSLLKSIILRAVNKLFESSYSWEEYASIKLAELRSWEPVALKEQYRKTEGDVLENSTYYLSMYGKYFMPDNKELFKYNPDIAIEITPMYDYSEVINYLKQFCLNAHMGTPVHDYLLKRSIERPLEEKALAEKKQKAKERREYLKNLAKRNDI